jgi:NADP-dependent 3-hydroxy acid dehydrogenase YdfG
MVYRAQAQHGVAWITGASSGIGRGVAQELARRGFTVYATARRADALTALALESGGRIVAAPADVTDRAALAALIADIEAKSPIALAVLNAGGSFADSHEDFGGDGFQQTFALNVQGVANSVNPVLIAMRARKRGQIAIVGSLSGYGGLPGAGAYGPSKAAVIAMAVGLKLQAERDNVTIQVVNPGFVKTPLTDGVRGPMPFIIDGDAACRRICDGLARGGFEIRFPRRFAWIARAVQSLPYPIFFALFRLARLR